MLKNFPVPPSDPEHRNPAESGKGHLLGLSVVKTLFHRLSRLDREN